MKRIAVLFGFSWGGLGNQVAALIGDIFGIRSIGAIMGALVAGWTIGGAIGPAIGGFAFDVNSSYSLSFALGSAGMLFAALFASLVKPQRIQSKGPMMIIPHSWRFLESIFNSQYLKIINYFADPKLGRPK